MTRNGNPGIYHTVNWVEKLEAGTVQTELFNSTILALDHDCVTASHYSHLQNSPWEQRARECKATMILEIYTETIIRIPWIVELECTWTKR
jgi:hypothetical protein